jgi:hypothetical protein
MRIVELLGRGLARYLVAPGKSAVRPATCRPEMLAASLRKGDVLLVEGSNRISTAVKYLTQSTWSHAALCVSDNLDSPITGPAQVGLVEADVVDGVRRVSLSRYFDLHTRICRPVGLTPGEIERVVAYALSRIGHQYDLKNVIDLARYLIQTPPVPLRWRRRLLALGSGDPTMAICSSLIAQAFQAVRYPILPESLFEKSNQENCQECYDEFLHIRHHSLFAPRDFDISPYFKIIKPTVENGFDPHDLVWIDDAQEAVGN